MGMALSKMEVNLVSVVLLLNKLLVFYHEG